MSGRRVGIQVGMVLTCELLVGSADNLMLGSGRDLEDLVVIGLHRHDD